MNAGIEKQIDDLIVAEAMTSQALSNALFGPMGLFGKLAKDEAERRAISQTPLFQRAQARISELRRLEHEEYQDALQRRCRRRSDRVAADQTAPVANGPANGAASEPQVSPVEPA